MTVPEMAPWSRLFSATEPATTHSMHVLTPGRSLIGDGGHRLGCPLPVTTHSRWQLPAAPLCRRQLAVSVRAQQAATLEKLKTPAPTPSIAEGEDKSIWKTTYDISNEDPRLTATWKKTIRVAVSGAAGQISNHLLFMLASGEVFGHDQPIALQMLGSERSAGALEGVAMELEDSLYPLLREVQISIDAEKAFADADWALLIGAKPRGPGMERRDLLDLNGQIFELQGKALDKVAKKDVKVMVVGNPCNTNALIALMNAPTLNPRNFHALTRLDENRAKCQLALRAGKFYTSVDRVCIWGNHSTTQVPDFLNARISGEPALDVIGDEEWLQTSFTNTVATRGGALIKKWGRSSAASTAVSIADAIKSLVTPTKPDDVFSSGVLSNGNPYGVADGLVYSFPCRSKGDGDYEIVDDFIIDDFLRQKLKISEDELLKERGCVGHLIPGDEAAACEITVDTMLPGEN